MEIDLQSRQRASASRLAIVALLVWTLSLGLAGIRFYDGTEDRGLLILMLGWLVPFLNSNVNVAPFANLLFLVSATRLLRGHQAVFPALLATLTSLDIFRFTQCVRDESSGQVAIVFAYGWGAVLWLTSYFLLLAAAGRRIGEAQGRAPAVRDLGTWAVGVGVSLAFLVLVFSSVLAVRDRNMASRAERERLSGLAFKRGAVCGAAEPAVEEPLRDPEGPLRFLSSISPDAKAVPNPPGDVMEPSRALRGALELVSLGTPDAKVIANPLENIGTLLDWGVPVVRVEGKEYRYSHVDTRYVVTSAPASTPVSATLTVATTMQRGRRTIRARFFDRVAGRVVFEQIWREESQAGWYCPSFVMSSDPNIVPRRPLASDQPRKLLLEAMGSTHARPGFDR